MIDTFDHVEDFIKLSEQEVWDLPKGNYEILFSNGTKVLHSSEIIISWYYWMVFRRLPVKNIPMENSVTVVTANTHLKVASSLFATIMEANLGYEPFAFAQLIYIITNKINNITYRLLKYSTTASLYDIQEIHNNVELQLAKKTMHREIELSDNSDAVIMQQIANVYKVIDSILFAPDLTYPLNGINKLTAAGLVNKGQVCQLFGPRGVVSDINNDVFAKPILASFSEGLHDLYSFVVESRSASKAIANATVALRESEYFNRQLGLALAFIFGIDFSLINGCSGYETIPWTITNDDTTLLIGKYHMVEGIAVMINVGNFNSLIGSTVHLRTLTRCGCQDRQKVCHICLGWFSNICYPERNVGFIIGVETACSITQKIMSTKHLLFTLMCIKIILGPNEKRWFELKPKNYDSIFLAPNKLIKFKIVLDKRSARQLAYIDHTDISELNPTRLTSITDFQICHIDDEGIDIGIPDYLNVAVGGSPVSLTEEVLNYLKLYGFKSDNKTITIIIDPDIWDYNDPFFNTPKKAADVVTFFKNVSAYLTPVKTGVSKITDFHTPENAIKSLISILNEQLKGSFNFAQVEIIIRALMIRSAAEKDYRIPLIGEDFEFSGLKEHAIGSRNLSSLFAFQGVNTNMYSSHYLLGDNEIPTGDESRHIFDYLLFPNRIFK